MERKLGLIIKTLKPIPENSIMAWLCLLLIFTVASGCSSGKKTQEITDIREVSAPTLPLKSKVTSAERFGFSTSPQPFDSANKLSGKSPFIWTTPRGWSERSPTSMRLINLKVTEDPETECYLTVLSGDAGGILQNVNRWRSQISLPPLSAGDLPEHPTRKLFGKDAYFVECEGTYTGMRGEFSKPDYKILGLILHHEKFSIFVKMIGPKETMNAEKKNFVRFCTSLQVR